MQSIARDRHGWLSHERGQGAVAAHFEAECVDGESLQLADIDKCEAWEWRCWTEVTEDLYLPLRLFKQTDYRPFLLDPHRTYVSI